MIGGFEKRATFELPEVDADLTDVNFRIVVPRELEMNPDFSDVRFYDSDDTTRLKHHRASYTVSGEVLTNGALTGGADWNVTGDFVLDNDRCEYSGTDYSTVYQEISALTLPIRSGEEYCFFHTHSGNTGTFMISRSVATTDTLFYSISPKPSPAKTFFTARSTPGNFEIKKWGGTPLTVNMDNFSLLPMNPESLMDGEFAYKDTYWSYENVSVYNREVSFSSEDGKITQAKDSMRSPGVAGGAYALTYTVVSSSGTPSAIITTDFAGEDVSLDLTEGTHTVIFAASSSPGDFVIDGTLSIYDYFVLEDLSLVPVAVFWIKVPSLPKEGKEIYMYYGNRDLYDESEPEDTYLFYDDFVGADGSTPDSLNWTRKHSGGAGDVVRIYDDSLRIPVDVDCGVWSTPSWDGDTNLVGLAFKTKDDSLEGPPIRSLGFTPDKVDTTFSCYAYSPPPGGLMGPSAYWARIGDPGTTAPQPDGGWHVVEINRASIARDVFYFNGVEVADKTGSDQVKYHVGLHSNGTYGTSGYVWIDYVGITNFPVKEVGGELEIVEPNLVVPSKRESVPSDGNGSGSLGTGVDMTSESDDGKYGYQTDGHTINLYQWDYEDSWGAPESDLTNGLKIDFITAEKAFVDSDGYLDESPTENSYVNLNELETTALVAYVKAKLAEDAGKFDVAMYQENQYRILLSKAHSAMSPSGSVLETKKVYSIR